MKILKLSLLTLFVGSLAITGCKKDESTANNGSPVPELNTVLGSLLANAPQAESFQLNAQFPTPIRTANGARYVFNNNSFLMPDGSIATGMIDVQITEHFSNSDLLLAGMPTISNGEQLVTGGQFLVEAFKNGQQLSASPQYNLNAEIPTNEPDTNMDLFIGEPNLDGTVNWMEANQGNLNVTEVFEEGDSSWYCSQLCGSIPMSAGSTLTISYTGSMSESSTMHSMSYEGLGDYDYIEDMTGFTPITLTATTDDVIYICINDFNVDGWQGAFLTLDVDGETAIITIDSDECEPMPFGYYYNLNTNHLGWINCDYQGWAGLTQDSFMIADLPADYECDDLVAYVVYPDFDGLGYSSCDGVSITSMSMPSNTNAVLCSIALIDDTYYSAFATATVNGETVVTLNYSETSIAEFEAFINGL